MKLFKFECGCKFTRFHVNRARIKMSLPWQRIPSPTYPDVQEQKYEPAELMHCACSPHGTSFIAHSFASVDGHKTSHFRILKIYWFCYAFRVIWLAKVQKRCSKSLASILPTVTMSIRLIHMQQTNSGEIKIISHSWPWSNRNKVLYQLLPSKRISIYLLRHVCDLTALLYWLYILIE